MLNWKQRWILFLLFCAFATLCVASEAYLIYSLVTKEVTAFKSILSLVNGGVLYPIARLFRQWLSETFLGHKITADNLHRFAAERTNVLSNQDVVDVYDIRRQLITNTLRYGEEYLRRWIPGSHFEFCVFVDPTEPLLFAYFDSNQDMNARSMAERAHNPLFYIEQQYEVTKLLSTPKSQPRVIGNTYDKKTKYKFTSPQQRKQIASTMLLCLDVKTPCALVVSSNETNALTDKDGELLSFIKYVGALVFFDLAQDNFVLRIRNLKPNLFSPRVGA